MGLMRHGRGAARLIAALTGARVQLIMHANDAY